VIHVGDVQAQDVEGYVLEGLDVLDDGEREEEEEEAREVSTGQGDVEAAVKLQTRAAMGAV